MTNEGARELDVDRRSVGALARSGRMTRSNGPAHVRRAICTRQILFFSSVTAGSSICPSSNCSLHIKELDLAMDPGTMDLPNAPPAISGLYWEAHAQLGLSDFGSAGTETPI